MTAVSMDVSKSRRDKIELYCVFRLSETIDLLPSPQGKVLSAAPLSSLSEPEAWGPLFFSTSRLLGWELWGSRTTMWSSSATCTGRQVLENASIESDDVRTLFPFWLH